MYRVSLAWFVAAIGTLAIFLPLLPGEKKDPLGRGAILRLIEENRALLQEPAEGGGRSAMLRFQGNVPKERILELMDRLEEVQRAAQREGGMRERCLQVRGIFENVQWVIAYDIYPIRVVCARKAPLTRHNDPVLPEADWVLTQLRSALKLEKVP